MSDEKNGKGRGVKRRVQLPDGTWGVYMGETGGIKRPVRVDRRREPANKAIPAKPPARNSVPDIEKASGRTPEGRRTFMSKYSLSEGERRDAERRKREIRQYRTDVRKGKFEASEEHTKEKKFYQRILDRIHMWHLGIAVNIDNIIKGAVCAVLIVFFAMLQITVFSDLRPLGAIPDLMLPLVIAIGITEGERWGGVCGLAAAFLIDCLGSAGITLLPLLYVPCGFAAGVLGTYYVRDSFVIRAVFSVASGVLRAIVTIIYVHLTYSAVNVPIMFGRKVIPEFFSTLLFVFIPHIAAWLSFRPFHKTRADRVD